MNQLYTLPTSWEHLAKRKLNAIVVVEKYIFHLTSNILHRSLANTLPKGLET